MKPNIKMLAKRLLIVFLIACSLKASAQKENQIAINGYKGNYIYNVFKPASLKHPDGEVIGFRLDRKAQTETNWQILYKVSTPASFEDLNENFEAAKNKVFEYKPAISYSVAEVWPVFKKTFNLDSVGPYVTQQAMAVAFNILLVDTAAKNNVVYQYKVVQLKKDGTEGMSYLSNPISSKDVFLANKPKKITRSADANVFKMVWKAKMNGKLPEALLIKRSEDINEPFKRYLISYDIEQRGDSVFYTLEDDKIKKEQLYRYTVTPVNRFGGGASALSDTISAAVIDPYLLTPKIFTVKTDSIKNNIVLNWSFIKPDFISGVSVYRSTDYEKDYQLIATTSGFNYIDRTAIAGQKYYYYIIVTDRLGRTTDRGVKAYGLMYNTKKPGPPINISVVVKGKQNVISWGDINNDTRGFYVYRTNQLEDELKPISGIIYTDKNAKGLFSFTDTATSLSGKTGYAVLTENTSNIRSIFTKTVYIQTAVTAPIAPTIIDIKKTGADVYVFWQDFSENKTVIGYNIYRKKGNSDYVKINKIPVLINKRLYKDSLTLNDQSVSYKITSVNSANIESTFSEEQTAQIAQAVYPPQALKSFFGKDNKTIILQWQPSQSEVAKYEIYRYIRGQEPVKINDVKANIATFTDANFNKTQTNYYFIKTIGLNGKISIPSSETYKEMTQ